MLRREALQLIATLCGGTIFGAERLLAGDANPSSARDANPFSASDLALLNEIADTILPTTPDSPGAKAADVAAFMEEIVRDFYTPAERATFARGIAALQSTSREKHSGRTFEKLNSNERHALLLTFENEKPQPPESYRMLKQLTFWGYFSSEIGVTQAYAHVAVPGRWEGCVTIDPKSTKPWAE